MSHTHTHIHTHQHSFSLFIIKVVFFYLKKIILATLQGFQDLSSSTRDQTQALGNESMGSQTLDHLRIPSPSSSEDFPSGLGNVGDLGLIPGLGKSPGEGHGNPLQYSCLESPHGQRSLEGGRLFIFLHSAHHLTGCISRHEGANAMKTRSGAVLLSAVFRGLAQVVLIPGAHSLRVCCAPDTGSQTQQRTTGKRGERHQRLWVQDAVRSLPSCGTSEESWSPGVQLISETGAPPTQRYPVSSSKDPVTPTVLFFSGKRLAQLLDGLCFQSFHNRCQLTKSHPDGALSDPELGFAVVCFFLLFP